MVTRPGMTGRALRHWILVPVAAASLMLAACGGEAEGPEPAQAAEPSAPSAETTVSIVLSNWKITADPASAPAGAVTFEAEVGNGYHALSVYRTDLAPDELPTNGPAAVDISDERIELMGHKTSPDGGGDFVLETQLEPGAYVLVCNLNAHYMRGMRTAFEVG